MAPSSLPVTLCRNIYYYLAHGVFYRPQPPPKDTIIQFVSDHDVLKAQREEQKVGKIAKVFDPRFDTQFFYTATARPREDGSIPVVDPEGKALYIYLHGSGTQKASGINFAPKANALANMGYSVLSFDLPFHMLGSRNAKLADVENFVEYLDRIIQAYRVKGQPVYLAGHSFGPGLIGEYVRRKPFGVDGAALISPASYNPELTKYFEQVTSMANRFWGDTKPNEVGAHWAGVVSHGNIWMEPPSETFPDPTVANPNLRLRVLSGDQDEYFPGKLDEYGEPTKEPRHYDFRPDFERVMKGAALTREPGVGHYIFTHTDSNGHDVVLRELLALHNDSLSQRKDMEKEFKARQYSSAETALMRFNREPLFAQWVNQEKGGKDELVSYLQNGDQKSAQNLQKDYQKAIEQRMEFVRKNIRLTAQWALQFFRENQTSIEKLGTKGFDETPLIRKYYELLDSRGLIERSRYSSAPTNSMVVVPPVAQERKPPSEITPEQILAQKERKEKLKRDKEKFKSKSEKPLNEDAN